MIIVKTIFLVIVYFFVVTSFVHLPASLVFKLVELITRKPTDDRHAQQIISISFGVLFWTILAFIIVLIGGW